MRRFKIVTAILLIIVMTTTVVFAIANLDEDGNIIENEPLPGGIVTMMEELDFGGWEDVPAFGSVTGEVTEFWHHDWNDVRFVRIDGVTSADFIFGNAFVLGNEIKVGDTITGFYNNLTPTTSIYPPQYTPLVLVNHEDREGTRVILDRFNSNWISSDNNFRLNINEDTAIYFQGGDVFEGEKEELIGRKLLVEFSVSHRDFPETIPNPERITILYELAVPPILELDPDWDLDVFDDVPRNIWDNIVWHGYPDFGEYDWSAYDIIISLNGLSRGVPNASSATLGDAQSPNYLPLRAITEMLGFVPYWNEADSGITVGNPRGEITFRIGEPHYTLTDPFWELSLLFESEPPVIINGRTYVPLSFFSEVYGLSVYLDEEYVMLYECSVLTHGFQDTLESLARYIPQAQKLKRQHYSRPQNAERN
jgi:hypothetical protein